PGRLPFCQTAQRRGLTVQAQPMACALIAVTLPAPVQRLTAALGIRKADKAQERFLENKCVVLRANVHSADQSSQRSDPAGFEGVALQDQFHGSLTGVLGSPDCQGGPTPIEYPEGIAP